MHEPDALSARETKREFEAVASGEPSATPANAQPEAALASFGVLCGDFMAMIATVSEIARVSGENRRSGRWCRTG